MPPVLFPQSTTDSHDLPEAFLANLRPHEDAREVKTGRQTKRFHEILKRFELQLNETDPQQLLKIFGTNNRVWSGPLSLHGVLVS